MVLMEVFSWLGLVIGLLCAITIMAGGKTQSVLRPAYRLVSSIISGGIRLITSVFGRSIKLLFSPKAPRNKEPEINNQGNGAGRSNDAAGRRQTPPRW
jgi:hypothetical protein